MRSRHLLTLSWLGISLVVALPALGSGVPRGVSPGAVGSPVATESRCPTFSWAGVPGARGYELAVFRIVESDAAVAETEPALVVRANLPRDARAWTPPSSQCLERGARYAWSIAATQPNGKELVWSEPLLLEVDAEPSLEEVERALVTLERFRRSHSREHGRSPSAEEPAQTGTADDGSRATIGAGEPVELGAGVDRNVAHRGSRDVLPGALTAPTTTTREVSAATGPTITDASLSLSGQLHLDATSSVFKDGLLFLWDDGAVGGNLALGRRALSNLDDVNAKFNTAIGADALGELVGDGSGASGLRNTAVGSYAARSTNGFSNTAVGAFSLLATTSGNRNTAVGAFTLVSNTTGYRNTTIGYNAMFANTMGSDNTALGAQALRQNSLGDRNTSIGYRSLRNNTGSDNIALGNHAGYKNTSGSNNIFIGNLGYDTGSEESTGRTIRIGTQTSGNNTHHNRTFIAGISGVAVTGSSVVVTTNGQLGITASSREYKQDIEGLEAFAERLLALRPVAFRYKEHVARNPAAPVEFGLIAEEVAEVFPELVIWDDYGKPMTVKYHLLSSLLLGELQQQHRVVEEQRTELEAIRARLAALERRPESPPRRRDGGSRSRRGP